MATSEICRFIAGPWAVDLHLILVWTVADVVVSGRYYVLAQTPRDAGLEMGEEAKSMDEEQTLVNLL